MSLDLYLQVTADVGGAEPHVVTLWSANYTHNCNTMAEAAGIQKHVWRPEELLEIKTAGDLVEPLRAGIRRMEEEPQKFIALNPANGFGSYETFLPWLKKYLAACMEYPKATIYASR
jgi:hypothetical protein